MKKLLLLIIALVSFSIADAQEQPKKKLINIGKFFKYSTFYGVGQISQPITPSERFYFVDQNNAVIDVTPEAKLITLMVLVLER